MLNVTNNSSNSASLVNNHEKRIEAELEQLIIDIRRIGPPGDTVTFGELFDDDDAQNYYEALVGTLKCAKKRGIIKFKGQMLLKGMHDNVTISIADAAGGSQSTNSAQQKSETESSSATPTANSTKKVEQQKTCPKRKQLGESASIHTFTPVRSSAKNDQSSTPGTTVKQSSSSRRTSGGNSVTPSATGLNESFDTAMAIKGTPAARQKASPNHGGLNASFDSQCAIKGTPVLNKSPGKLSHSFLTPPRNSTYGTPSRTFVIGPPPPPPPLPPPSLPPSAQRGIPSQTQTLPEDNASDTETEISVRRNTPTSGFTPKISEPNINMSDSEAEVVEKRSSPRAKSKHISSTAKRSSRKSVADRWTQRTSENSWKNPTRNNNPHHVRHHSTSDIGSMDGVMLTSSSPANPPKSESSTSPGRTEGKENRRRSSTKKKSSNGNPSQSSPSPRKSKSRVKITVMAGDKAVESSDAVLPASTVDDKVLDDDTLTTPQVLKKTKSLQPKGVPGSAPAKSNMHRAKSERIVASIGAGMDEEVGRLLKDIYRVGSNPGEANVTFGELFDDDIVQNTYEALIGTLRSAKRQGLIKFQGQVLFKGMHDNVVISVVESK